MRFWSPFHSNLGPIWLRSGAQDRFQTAEDGQVLPKTAQDCPSRLKAIINQLQDVARCYKDGPELAKNSWDLAKNNAKNTPTRPRKGDAGYEDSSVKKRNAKNNAKF